MKNQIICLVADELWERMPVFASLCLVSFDGTNQVFNRFGFYLFYFVELKAFISGEEPDVIC